MFRNLNCFCTQIVIVILYVKTCNSEPQTPYLALYSPRDTEYTDVLVRRVHDNLTLVCEVRGDPAPRVFVWNYVSDNGTDGGRSLATEPSVTPVGSRLEIADLQPGDTGHYICSAPPFSSTKYVLVQPKGPHHCARGAFWCGARCVLPAYVCDGRRDCARAEDEAPPLCARAPCAGADKLNCSSGRCIPEAACCRPGAPLCRQPACCDEHARYSTLEGADKLNCSSGRCIPEAACCRPGAPLCRQPACCDEHARYSTLEGYTEVEYPPLFEDRRAPDEYGFIQSTIYTVTACALIFMIAVVLLVSALCKMHMKRAALRGYASAHRDTAHHYAARYPPRYEMARLLEPGLLEPGLLEPGPPAAPRSAHAAHAAPELPSPETPSTAASEPPETPRYSGGFGLARLSSIFCSRYRQVPTQCCDVEMRALRRAAAGSPQRAAAECDPDLYYADPELTPAHLDYMAAPDELFRRTDAIERAMEQLAGGARPLTLQLGRFQLSLPRFRRDEPRADTPDVDIGVGELDTYTLNGRTVRLLGARFDGCPAPPAPSARPPPYCEAVRLKRGPPPRYLSSERVHDRDADADADRDVEMPPCYEDLARGVDADADADIANITINVIDITDNNVTDNDNGNDVTVSCIAGTDVTIDRIDGTASGNINANGNVTTNISTGSTVNDNDLFVSNDNAPETISSVIDNLPAIDSDVNANETLYRSAAIDT